MTILNIFELESKKEIIKKELNKKNGEVITFSFFNEKEDTFYFMITGYNVDTYYDMKIITLKNDKIEKYDNYIHLLSLSNKDVRDFINKTIEKNATILMYPRIIKPLNKSIEV